MKIKAWPFLISRNQYLDYRTIIAPDFICKAKITSLLARVADADLTEPKSLIVRQVQGSKVGNFTIAFRVIKATEQDIDNEGHNNKILKDQFGREIYLIEGLVVKEMRNLVVTDKDFNKAHQELIKEYSLFWNCVEPPSVIYSQEFTLENDPSNSLRLIEMEPFLVNKNSSRSGKDNFSGLTTSIFTGNKITLLAFIVAGLILLSWIVKVILPLPSLTAKIVTVNEKLIQEKQIYAEITNVQAGNSSVKYSIIDWGNSGFVVTDDGKSIYKIRFSDDQSATTEKKSITLKNTKKASAYLIEFQDKYSKAAIFLSGELKVESSKKELKMDYEPICQAITKVSNQRLNGKLNATIIDPKPEIFPAKLCS